MIEISVTLVHKTERAILVEDGDQEVWLPKSQIKFDAANAGETISVELPEWLAMKNGLI